MLWGVHSGHFHSPSFDSKSFVIKQKQKTKKKQKNTKTKTSSTGILVTFKKDKFGFIA